MGDYFEIISSLALGICAGLIIGLLIQCGTEPETDVGAVLNTVNDSGLYSIIEDSVTGCQYIASYTGGFTPRIREDGTLWCGDVQ